MKKRIIIKGLPKEEIRKAYLKDVQLKLIAEKYGVHTKTIRKRLKWMGVYKKSRRAGNKRNIDLRKLKPLIKKRIFTAEDTPTVKAIAEPETKKRNYIPILVIAVVVVVISLLIAYRRRNAREGMIFR